MISTTKTPIAALVCAIALIATACGGGSTASDELTSGDGAPESSAQNTSTTQTEESPFAELLGIPIGSDDEMQQYFSDLTRDAEVKIAECMLAQGFQYQVIDFADAIGSAASIDFESREFAEQYGFGITSNPFEQSFSAFEDFEDPNETYLESLSDGELDAYNLALSGEPPDLEDPESFDSFEPGGCQADAYNELFSFTRVFSEFGDEFEELEAAFEADPRMVEAGSGWTGCMTEAGYQYADQDTAKADIRTRHNEILGSSEFFAAPAPDAESGSVTIEAAGPGEEDSFGSGPQSLPPEVQAEVDVLAVEERAIAVASWDCDVPRRDIEREVQLEYEQRFVDENGAEISAMLNE